MSNYTPQEDEDLQRAIAASLGQTYIPPKNKTTSQTAKTTDIFEPQKQVTYTQAVDELFNGNCCVGIYDKKIKQWRTATYINKWDDNKRLMLRYTQEGRINVNQNNACDRFITIGDFPVDYIILRDHQKFQVKERDLRDMSNIPKQNIDLWIRRQKHWKLRSKSNDNNAKEEKDESDKKSGVSASVVVPQDKTVAIGDWSKRRDFTGVMLVGYLCDDGEVIQGDCLRQKPGKIFVHFNTDAAHFGKKYEWITVPNERICPPPKHRPKPRNINNNNYNIDNEDDDLQKAIEASLQDLNANNSK